MALFTKTYHVAPNLMGYLYRSNVLEKTLPPGIYEVPDWRNRTNLVLLPIMARMLNVVNQEVLTRDNVALRFSFFVLYRISEGTRFLDQFYNNVYEAETRISTLAGLEIRRVIASLDSETLNDRRAELIDFLTEAMKEEAAKLGILLEQAQVRDVTFPKNIQDLFARQLESKIRAKADLENARTAVATARTLKNASEMMKGDENVKFFQWLELMGKIAEKGKHTFLIGDVNGKFTN